ncbi:CheY-like chemotaxis protein [Rhizobium sp. BK650]|uniref:hypothetical protein n=1 Tax=Rhizobium sp. BK650 TaxID=2586990 RepID=UPI0016184DED|nr:hypothetical protein [Rhizobium sp. BK650]MBB3660130.1 CheY-like chemotaxis protein [Rhizobium sp. BK650]
MTSQMIGQRILLVEDDYCQARVYATGLKGLGADVAGPFRGVSDAIKQLHSGGPVTAGVLDIDLSGDMVYPVADELAHRDIPFVFVTGYDPGVLPARFENKTVLSKPLTSEDIARALDNLATGEEIRRQEVSLNSILRRLPRYELDLALPHLHRVELPQGEILEQPGHKISMVYFPLECVASMIAVDSDGKRIEAGLVGREGMTGFGFAVDDEQTPYDLVNQIQGTALAMTAENFLPILEVSRSLQALAMRFSRIDPTPIHSFSRTTISQLC